MPGRKESKKADEATISHWRLLYPQGFIDSSIRSQEYSGNGTTEDPFIVNWLPENDLRNPMDWPARYKWMVVGIMAIAVMSVSFCSSMFSGAIPGLMLEFEVGEEIATLGLSVFVLGFALGPFVWAPLSEIFGRQVLFAISFAGLTLFNSSIVAASNIWTVIVLRFLAGAFGSSPLTNSGGVIADMFTSRQRGVPMICFGSAPFLGPLLGPIVGGFASDALNWRWVTGIMAVSSGVMWLIVMTFTPETYAPVLLRQRAKALTKETGCQYRSTLDVEDGPVRTAEVFATSLSRPWGLLFKEPIVLTLSVYLAIIYGSLYMLFASYPLIYQQGRSWSTGIGGLAFTGTLLGLIAGFAYALLIDSPRYVRTANAHDGAAPPEARLTGALVGALALPLGLFWFAWTAQPSMPYLASIAAGVPFGFGMVLVFLSVLEYLIDAYSIFAASALAANTVLRSLFGAGFPLVTKYMYQRLGVNWASSIPAFLALACVPFPFLFYKYGSVIRQRGKYSAESGRFLQESRNGEPNTKSGSAQPGHTSRSSSYDTRQSDEEKSHDAVPVLHGVKSAAAAGQIASPSRCVLVHHVVYEGNPYVVDRANTRRFYTRVAVSQLEGGKYDIAR